MVKGHPLVSLFFQDNGSSLNRLLGIELSQFNYPQKGVCHASHFPWRKFFPANTI
jgi:hypothetical protein